MGWIDSWWIYYLFGSCLSFDNVGDGCGFGYGLGWFEVVMGSDEEISFLIYVFVILGKQLDSGELMTLI